MSRVIKFRAWDGKQMLQHHEINFDWLQEGDFTWVKPMQFTGLFDRNGKEIYEGDIVKDSELVYYIRFGEISFDEYAGIGWLLCGIPEKDDNNFFISPDDVSVIEVIGNIYENSDLINQHQLAI